MSLLPRLLLVSAIALLLFSVVFTQEQAKDAPTTPTVENDVRVETRGSKTDDTNDEALKKMRDALNTGSKYQFQAEINQLLGIIINSLYTNKEIFLRELISNASDALDKIRFFSLTNSTALAANPKLEIRVRAIPETNTLIISDTGIGMTQADLQNNLGTIARSGTKAFVEKLKQSKDSLSLIGQFGVGFYSAFLVADSVIVASKHNDDKQYIWESKADNTFIISEDPRGNTLGRGTEITLQLKDDAKEYLDQANLKDLIAKYSEFIQYPIYLYTVKNETKTVPVETPKTDESTKKDEDVKVEEEKKPASNETKTITEITTKWEAMNENKPIWTRNPKDVTKEEYINFYKTITKDTEAPLSWSHFKSEGSNVDFRSILYIPGTAPHNMFDFLSKSSAIRLYVKRVFITDALNDMMPRYLNFIRGIVDSDDLPLNISREILQNSKLLKLIKKALVTKAISLIRQLAEKEAAAKKKQQADQENKEKTADEQKDKEDAEDATKFTRFWKDYGKSIRLGVIEDTDNRPRLLKLLRYYSTKSEFIMTTLDEYLSRMKSTQKNIFYIAGESIEELRKSPFLEEFKNRDIEVLYMTDPIDEYMTGAVREYEGKELQSISREGVKFEDDTEEKKAKIEATKKEFEALTTYFKDSLGQKIIRADIGSRFTGPQQSPCVIAATQYGYTANMVRIMKAQTIGANEQQFLNMYANAKVVELNPFHPVIVELNKRIKTDKNDKTAKGVVELLYETAALRSGYGVDDSSTFADKIFDLMKSGLTKDEEPTSTKRDEL